MSRDEIIAVLRLQNVPNIGDVTAKKLISDCGSPSAIFEDKMHHLLKMMALDRLPLRGLMDMEHLEAASGVRIY